jgi:hypothetical protein
MAQRVTFWLGIAGAFVFGVAHALTHRQLQAERAQVATLRNAVALSRFARRDR